LIVNEVKTKNTWKIRLNLTFGGTGNSQKISQIPRLSGTGNNPNSYTTLRIFIFNKYIFLVPQEELLSTREDCISVINNRALPNQNFETNILVTRFYVFYYSIFSFKLQQKLEQNIINNYFINEIVHKNESQREYLPENIIEPFKLATGKDVPPQIHYGLVNYVNYIYFYFLNIISTLSFLGII